MKEKQWSFWQAGIALGLLSALSMWLLKPLGVSTAYSTTDGMLLKLFAPDYVANQAYFQTVPVKIGWEWMLVVGMVIGGFIAARLSRPRGFIAGGRLNPKRPLVAFIGGFLVLFGARMAGGCTSGHVISGMTQMAVSGMLFAAAVFAAGIPTALYFSKRNQA